MELPLISIVVLTLNEEKNIGRCLKSIFRQDYPKDKLEVIVVDDGSTDRTVEIARNFPVRILTNGKKDADLSATIGFHAATGDFFAAIGADMRFRGKDWFKKMTKPSMENPDIVTAVTKFYPHPNDSLITKYLNLDLLQRDLVYQIFSIGFKEVISQKRKGYYICQYSANKIPPQAHGLYRVSVMRKIIKQQKIWYDMGNLVLLVKNGYRRFAYVPNAGYYHFHADSLKSVLGKRIRNIERSYLRYSAQEGHFRWFDLKNPKDLAKIILLIISANLFFPILLLSIFRMIKYRNWLYILEAPVTLALVDTIIFVFIKDGRGRKFIIDNLPKIKF